MLNIETALRSLTEDDCVKACNAVDAIEDYFDSDIDEAIKSELKASTDNLLSKFSEEVVIHALVCKLM